VWTGYPRMGSGMASWHSFSTVSSSLSSRCGAPPRGSGGGCRPVFRAKIKNTATGRHIRAAARDVDTARDQLTDGASGEGAWMQAINCDQSKQKNVDILCAAHVSHALSQRVETLQGAVAAVLALGSFASSFAHSLTPWFAVASFLWIGVSEFWLATYSRRWTNLATRFQERFDRDVFDLPWPKDVGPRPTDGEVSRISSRFVDDRARKVDWYVDVRNLPKPYAILICQRENLVWDESNRTRWAIFLWRIVALWCAIGVVIGLAQGWTVFHLLARWLAPSSAALWLCARSAHKHNEIAHTKQRLALSVSDKIAEVSPGIASAEVESSLVAYCETLQRRIFALRDHPERVPKRVYWRSRNKTNLWRVQTRTSLDVGCSRPEQSA
jgi:SMODS-associating 4TM effector domain